MSWAIAHSVVDHNAPLFDFPNAGGKILDGQIAVDYINDVYRKAKGKIKEEDRVVLGADELANLEPQNKEWMFSVSVETECITKTYNCGLPNIGFISSLCGLPLAEKSKFRWKSNDDFWQSVQVGGLNEEPREIRENKAKTKLNINQPAYLNVHTSMNYLGESGLQNRVVNKTMWETLREFEKKTNKKNLSKDPTKEVMQDLQNSLATVSTFQEIELFMEVIPGKNEEDLTGNLFPWAKMWEPAYFEYHKYLLPPMSSNSKKITMGMKLSKNNKSIERELMEIMGDRIDRGFKSMDLNKQLDISHTLMDTVQSRTQGKFRILCINSEPVNPFDTLRIRIMPK